MPEAADTEFDLRGELEAATEGSRAVTLLRRTSRAAQTSRLAALFAWLVHVTTRSFLYRWFTKEPDPAMIIIDLRETYTVGPVIAVLDRLVDVIAPLLRTSVLKRANDTFVTLLAAVARTRTGRTVVNFLEPPPPPEEREE